MSKKGSKNKKYKTLDGGPVAISAKNVDEVIAGIKKSIKEPGEIRIVDPVQATFVKATLKVLGHIYESQGNTIDEVLNNFKTDHWVKGAGVLTIEKDGIKREKIIAGNHIRNLFGMVSGTLRTVSLKFVRSLFI